MRFNEIISFIKPYLKYLIIFFIVVVVLVVAAIIVFFVVNNSKKYVGNDVIKINPIVGEFLREESFYRKNFLRYKNVVFYGETCSCPYSKKFSSKLESLIKNGTYNINYKFVVFKNEKAVITMKDKDYEEFLKLKDTNPEVYEDFLNQGRCQIEDVLPESQGSLLNEFYLQCGVFCIVNSKATKMIGFKSIGNTEINQLESILDKYKDKW